MDLGAVFLLLAVVVLVGLFISRPFFEKDSGPDIEVRHADADGTPGRIESASRQEHRRSMLLAEQDRLLTALGELDFDHALNKIPDEDYPEQRMDLLRQGADVLRQLDALDGETHDQSVEDRLEKVIAARRADASRRSPEDPGRTPAARPAAAGEARGEPLGEALAVEDDLEQLISSQRQSLKEQPAGFCPHCGKPVQKSDRFCPRCGGSIAPKKA
jgi:hypothetical protein